MKLKGSDLAEYCLELGCFSQDPISKIISDCSRSCWAVLFPTNQASGALFTVFRPLQLKADSRPPKQSLLLKDDFAGIPQAHKVRCTFQLFNFLAWDSTKNQEMCHACAVGWRSGFSFLGETSSWFMIRVHLRGQQTFDCASIDVPDCIRQSNPACNVWISHGCNTPPTPSSLHHAHFLDL